MPCGAGVGHQRGAEFVDGQANQLSGGGFGFGGHVRWRWPRPGRRGRACQGGPAVPGSPAPTWCWSSPVRPLAACKVPRCVQRCPATRTQDFQRDRARAVAAQYASSPVASLRPISSAGVRCRLLGLRAACDPAPTSRSCVVRWLPDPARTPPPDPRRSSVNTSASTQLGPALNADAAVGAETANTYPSPVAAHAGAQARVGAIHLIPGRPNRARTPASTARLIKRLGQRRFGRENPRCLGIPAAAQRSVSISPRLGQIQAHGRSARARVARHRSQTPPPGHSRSARQCHCIALHADGVGTLLDIGGLIDNQQPRPDHRRHRSRSHADHRGPHQHPISRVKADAATHLGSPVRGARRSSNSSCDRRLDTMPQHQRPPHGAAARRGKTAARSDRSPRQTQSTTDQGLRCEPRRPRQLQVVFTNPERSSVTASTKRRHATPLTSRFTAAV